jgi:RimJ/RimL family protein N-acetyltransferase
MSPIIETRRLEMSKLIADDIDLLYQLTGDREVMKFFPNVLSYGETRQMLDEILGHYERFGHCFWKVLLKSSGDFVGIAGLLHQEIDGEAETAEPPRSPSLRSG